MATQRSQKPVQAIIVDTGPLIKNAVSISTILNSAEVLYTTPAIISEIRDPATRSRVETTLLPFLNIKTPSPASYEAVTAFARKTGDFPVLSRQDLGILALAYEVHCEKHGGPWGLRDAPKGPVKVKPGDEKEVDASSKEADKSVEVSQQSVPQDDIAEHGAHSEEQRASQEPTSQQGPQPSEETPPSEGTAVQLVDPPPSSSVDTAKEEEQTAPEQIPASEPAEEPREIHTATDALEQPLSELKISDPAGTTRQPTPPASEDSDSDGGEWITPSNVAKHKAKDADTVSLPKDSAPLSVATMTTDFAMQNVLLQMNMHLLSPNMQRIRRLRTSVLRCHACFLVTKEMDKQFCPRCGQPALKRVSCSTNAKGEFQIHLAKNYQYNNRGNRYSVPKPVAGTSNGRHVGQGGGKGGWGRDLVLAEDQKEYQRQVQEGKRTKARDLMDEDYLPGLLTGERGRAGGRPKVGAGKNINSRKRF